MRHLVCFSFNLLGKSKHCLTDTKFVHKSLGLLNFFFNCLICSVLFLRPQKNLVVELYPGTGLSLFCFNLPTPGSPCVLHREQGRKIPSACMGVRGRSNTPPPSWTHGRLGWADVCVEKHSRNGTGLSRTCSWGSRPSAPLHCEGGDSVCLFTCRLLSQLGGTSTASVPVCGMAAACVIGTKQGSMTENPSIPGL